MSKRGRSRYVAHQCLVRTRFAIFPCYLLLKRLFKHAEVSAAVLEQAIVLLKPTKLIFHSKPKL